jgi:hypothetical protein
VIINIGRQMFVVSYFFPSYCNIKLTAWTAGVCISIPPGGRRNATKVVGWPGAY